MKEAKPVKIETKPVKIMKKGLFQRWLDYRVFALCSTLVGSSVAGEYERKQEEASARRSEKKPVKIQKKKGLFQRWLALRVFALCSTSSGIFRRHGVSSLRFHGSKTRRRQIK